jgi:hypothetical protein
VLILLKEHQYRVQIGAETRILLVEEHLSGPTGWAGKFRVKIPADTTGESRIFYGSSDQAVAYLAAEYLNLRRQNAA